MFRSAPNPRGASLCRLLIMAGYLLVCSSPVFSADEEYLIGVVFARHELTIASETQGHLAAILVDLGDRVEAGDLLARLDTGTIDQDLLIHRADNLAVIAAQDIAVLRLQAAEEHLRRRVASPESWPAEEIDAARLEAGLAAAELKIAEARVVRAEATVARLEIQLAAAEFRAPFAGRIAQRFLDADMFVQPGTPLVRLISSEDLLVRFTVDENQILQVALGDGVTIELPSIGATIKGIIRNIGPEIDAALQRLTIEAVLVVPADSAYQIKSGMSARIFLTAAR